MMNLQESRLIYQSVPSSPSTTPDPDIITQALGQAQDGVGEAIDEAIAEADPMLAAQGGVDNALDASESTADSRESQARLTYLLTTIDIPSLNDLIITDNNGREKQFSEAMKEYDTFVLSSSTACLQVLRYLDVFSEFDTTEMREAVRYTFELDGYNSDLPPGEARKQMRRFAYIMEYIAEQRVLQNSMHDQIRTLHGEALPGEHLVRRWLSDSYENVDPDGSVMEGGAAWVRRMAGRYVDLPPGRQRLALAGMAYLMIQMTRDGLLGRVGRRGMLMAGGYVVANELFKLTRGESIPERIETWFGDAELQIAHYFGLDLELQNHPETVQGTIALITIEKEDFYRDFSISDMYRYSQEGNLEDVPVGANTFFSQNQGTLALAWDQIEKKFGEGSPLYEQNLDIKYIWDRIMAGELDQPVGHVIRTLISLDPQAHFLFNEDITPRPEFNENRRHNEAVENGEI